MTEKQEKFVEIERVVDQFMDAKVNDIPVVEKAVFDDIETKLVEFITGEDTALSDEACDLVINGAQIVKDKEWNKLFNLVDVDTLKHSELKKESDLFAHGVNAIINIAYLINDYNTVESENPPVENVESENPPVENVESENPPVENVEAINAIKENLDEIISTICDTMGVKFNSAMQSHMKNVILKKFNDIVDGTVNDKDLAEFIMFALMREKPDTFVSLVLNKLAYNLVGSKITKEVKNIIDDFITLFKLTITKTEDDHYLKEALDGFEWSLNYVTSRSVA